MARIYQFVPRDKWIARMHENNKNEAIVQDAISRYTGKDSCKVLSEKEANLLLNLLKGESK